MNERLSFLAPIVPTKLGRENYACQIRVVTLMQDIVMRVHFVRKPYLKQDEDQAKNHVDALHWSRTLQYTRQAMLDDRDPERSFFWRRVFRTSFRIYRSV